jgi:hypothetical protein
MSASETPESGAPANALLDADAVRRFADGKHADQSKFRRFLTRNRPAIGSAIVAFVMLAIFFVGDPTVFQTGASTERF